MASSTPTVAVPRPAAPARRRRWAFRLLAVLIGLSPLVAFEGLCAVFDWGRPGLHDDPFVGFRAVRPLFVLNDDTGRYEIPKARQTYFRPDSFAAVKADDEFRIFCLGGSTVQGRPFAIETAFSRWLEISLTAADRERTWRVVNCGGVSYASYRLVPILEEVLHYQPDLIILYTGHNEFLEARSFEHLGRRGTALNAALDAASRLRTFTLVREGYLRSQGRSSAEPPAGRPILPEEVEALLDYRGGLAEYHRDDAWRSGVIEQFGYNLRRMVQMADRAGVELILVNPVSNWRDSPPFKSEHGSDLSEAQRQKWQSLCESASRHLRREHYDPSRALRLLEEACRLDPRHAGGWYNLAGCYEALGQLDPGRDAYLRAKEEDVCPLRILQPMNDFILALARETGTPLINAQKLFEARSGGGITGGDWLVDHVHPTIEGHQLLADALAQMLVDEGHVTPTADWASRRCAAFHEHFEALSPLYFQKGMQRLSALKNWAQGRVSRLRGQGAAAAAAKGRHPDNDRPTGAPGRQQVAVT